MNQPKMAQPIPRSFFKDGQRAKYSTMDGKIEIILSKVVSFVYDEDKSSRIILLHPHELLYTSQSLELLDRTIDQVMEGDTVVKGRGPGAGTHTCLVLARVGQMVAMQDITAGGREPSWISIEKLEELNYTIKQSSNPEVMTDETAKALREEAKKMSDQIEVGDRYCYFERDKEGDDCVRYRNYAESSVDLALRETGNMFFDTGGGRAKCKDYGKIYLPAFLHVSKE